MVVHEIENNEKKKKLNVYCLHGVLCFGELIVEQRRLSANPRQRILMIVEDLQELSERVLVVGVVGVHIEVEMRHNLLERTAQLIQLTAQAFCHLITCCRCRSEGWVVMMCVSECV